MNFTSQGAEIKKFYFQILWVSLVLSVIAFILFYLRAWSVCLIINSSKCYALPSSLSNFIRLLLAQSIAKAKSNYAITVFHLLHTRRCNLRVNTLALIWGQSAAGLTSTKEQCFSAFLSLKRQDNFNQLLTHSLSDCTLTFERLCRILGYGSSLFYFLKTFQILWRVIWTDEEASWKFNIRLANTASREELMKMVLCVPSIDSLIIQLRTGLSSESKLTLLLD